MNPGVRMTDAWQVRPTLPAEVSRRMLDTAISQATALSTPITVVTADESGVINGLRRMDGAPLVSVQTAWNKAYAAAAIGMPPDDFYSAIESDGAAVASFATRPGLISQSSRHRTGSEPSVASTAAIHGRPATSAGRRHDPPASGCALSTCCATCTPRAAAVKLVASSTARKYRK
jgi:uncharacterized protein GlcG (DUF336 family)